MQQRKKGDIETVKLDEVTGDAALAGLEVDLRHEGPGICKRWVFALQRLKQEELRRIVIAREGLTPELAPELFDGKVVKIKRPRIDITNEMLDGLLEKATEDYADDTEVAEWGRATVVELVAMVKALKEPEEVDVEIIPPVRDDKGNIRFVTEEGLTAITEFAERVVAEVATSLRVGGVVTLTDGKAIAAELRRVGAIEPVMGRAMEVQSLTKAEQFPAAGARDVVGQPAGVALV